MLEIIFSAALTFPKIDPVLVELGPFAIRWYSLAYLAGWGFAWFYLLKMIKKPGAPCTEAQISDYMFWAMMGIILGGRLGYVLFYNLGYFLENPSKILAVWDGGMSFHGGFLGVAVASYIFSRKNKIAFFRFTDLIACASPVGLFLGRLANFIKGELFGRTTDAPVGMVFPGGGPLPRHPSQLYEAALEGVVLFTLLWALFTFTNVRKKPGVLTGVFLLGYAAARTLVEHFREPDAHLGFIGGTDFLTMGQTLSVPMVLVGLYLVFRPHKKIL